MIVDGRDVRLRYDYERADGGYGQRELVFENCTAHRFRRESEISYSAYRAAYNAVAFDGQEYHVLFDGYGLWSFRAEGVRDGGDRFEGVMAACRGWLGTVGGKPEVVLDSAEALRVRFETEFHLAELLVHRAEWAPYRYVSFQVLDVRLPLDQGPVYCFFDGAESTIGEILAGLDAGMRMMEGA